jgi:hypothetical protein
MQRSGLDASDVGCLQAQGLGSALGDPTEVGGIMQVLGSGRDSSLTLGSHKANFGHAEAPSGLMGLLCAWEVTQSKASFANAQLRILHSFLSQIFASAPMPTCTPTQLSTGETLDVCSVTAYGFSGVIAHGILKATSKVEPIPLPPLRRPKFKWNSFAWRSSSHPLVQEQVYTSSDEVVFQSPGAGAFFNAVADHIIMGGVVFPGAGYALMAEAASRAVKKSALVQRTRRKTAPTSDGRDSF